MDLESSPLVRRFMDYIRYDTQSEEENEKDFPSTPGQLTFARRLAGELKALGLEDVTLDAHGYVMATIPASPGAEGAPVVGFISHLDTSAEAPGGPVNARIVEDYDGGDITLNPAQGIVLSPKTFPELLDYVHEPIVVTDGTTLLGADDKAGIAAIVTAAAELKAHPELVHGRIRLAFTPEEETGRGTKYFDVRAFGADFAYTVDGGALGGLEYENFNAANPVVTFHGVNVHTGDAKGKMVNAITLASEWQQALPEGEKPEHTEGYEGFFHVYKIEGTVEQCTLHMLVRDHDAQKFAAKKAFLEKLADFLRAKYGPQAVELQLNDVYRNMREVIEDGHMGIVELAKRAMREAGVKPVISPIRGGTDGAMLSFRQLPCPNLFTGGMNYHGRYEYLPLKSLAAAEQVVLRLMVDAADYPAQKSKKSER